MTDTSEFEAFMRRHQDMVFTTAHRLLASEAEAADIAQEVFLKAHTNFASLRSNERAGGWLRTVARNLSLNHLTRYRARWRFFSEFESSESTEDFASRVPAESSNPSDGTEEARREALEAALARLPNHQRVPLVLYHFDDLSYEDIAAQLGVTLGKIKTDIHRGRAALRHFLQLDDEGQPIPRTTAAPQLARTP